MLLVDKPTGVSSHDVVLVARRATGERRIGHAGTLDPFATGLLVLLLGRATRLIRYLHDEPKIYEATIRFGADTDTEDLDGTVVREAALPTRPALDAAARDLVGEIAQVPPAYSAKRVQGRRSYELAREGAPVALAPVSIVVHSLALGAFEGEPDAVEQCTLRVSCGGGTYVRSLARDLARAAGSAAHLIALRRFNAGAFDVRHAVSIEALRSGTAAMGAPLDALVGHPVQDLTEAEVGQVVRGIDVEARVAGAQSALVAPRVGDAPPVLVAFAERRPSERGDRWQPRVVMRDA